MWAWARQLAVRSRFDRYPDCYAVSRERLLSELVKSVGNSRQQCSLTLVVCHFVDTFEQVQEYFEAHQISFGILSQKATAAEVGELAVREPGQVWLTLGQMLTVTRDMPPIAAKCSFGVIVCERHPDWEIDQQVDKFGRVLPGPTKLGYFSALTDPTIRLAVPDQMVTLLKTLGLDDQELITSSMITKRLKTVLSRLKRQRLQDHRDADSAQVWIAENLKL